MTSVPFKKNPALLVSVPLTAFVVAAGLAGCSNPGATTCDQYAAMSNKDRVSTEDGLLAAHHLQQLSVSNSVGLTQDIDRFCGVLDNIIAGLPGSTKATQNNSVSIDKAVDWTKTTW